MFNIREIYSNCRKDTRLSKEGGGSNQKYPLELLLPQSNFQGKIFGEGGLNSSKDPLLPVRLSTSSCMFSDIIRRGDELRGLRAAYLIKRAFDDDTVRERASARERERGRLKSGTLIVKYLLYYK